jgi:PAS domain S-box-containing protein
VLEMPQSSSKLTSALQIFSRYAAISIPFIGAGVVIGWSLEIGIAIMVMAATITLSVLFWLNARSLDREAERTQVAEARRESEAHTRAVLNSALDSIISMDHEGKVIEFNPAAEKTFGYNRQAVIGRLLVDLIIPHSLRERHRRGFAHYLATGKVTVLDRRIEITAMRSDGSEFPGVPCRTGDYSYSRRWPADVHRLHPRSHGAKGPGRVRAQEPRVGGTEPPHSGG